MKKGHQPPAKIRYNQTHPTVSIRVSQELYDHLKDLREKSGKSLGDILREALGKQAPVTQRAFDRGYAKAKEKFQVTYPCSVCSKPVLVSTPHARREIASHMKAKGWAHAACLNN